MRITTFITSLGGGGAERAVVTALRHWVDAGHDVTLVTLASADEDLNEPPPGVERHALGLVGVSSSMVGGLRNNVRRFRALRSVFEDARPDVIVSHVDNGNVLVLLATRGLRTPVVVTEHVDPTSYRPPRAWRVLRRITYRWSAALVVVTEGARPWGARLVGRARVHFIPNAIGIEPLERSDGEDRVPSVVALGRLVEQKGIDLLLEAFARCSPDRPAWKLVVYGQGPELGALTALARSLGIADHVSFPGYVRDPATALAQAEIFALPSRFEGLPVALLEAMAAGLPVIASDTPGGGTRHVISDGVDGYLVPVGSVDGLAAVLARLMDDPAERRRLGEKARDVRNRFGPETVMREWDALLAAVGRRDAQASIRDDGRLRITCVMSEFPLPRDRGGQLRNLGILEALARCHTIHVICPRRPDTTEEQIREVEGVVNGPVELFEPRLSERSAPLNVAARWLLALLSLKPPWVAMTFTRRFKQRVATLARASDVVLFMEGGYEVCPPALSRLEGKPTVVFDKHSVAADSIAAAQGRDTTLRRRVRNRVLITLTRRAERSSLRRADLVVVPSPEESDRLARLYGRSADATIPSAVHLPAPARARGGRLVGYLGGLDYAPNYDGLARFLRAGWPQLHDRGVTLVVDGRRGDPADEPSVEGVELLGFVEDQDFQGFLDRLSAAVVPLWEGGGVKLKTLTLMGAGIPIAATPVALEGIPAVDGRHCLISDDPHGLADAVETLVTDRALAERLGAGARALVADQFSWGRVGPEYVRTIERAARTRERSRR